MTSLGILLGLRGGDRLRQNTRDAFASEFPKDERGDNEVEEGAGEDAAKDDDGDRMEDFATGLYSRGPVLIDRTQSCRAPDACLAIWKVLHNSIDSVTTPTQTTGQPGPRWLNRTVLGIGIIAFAVVEKQRAPVPHISFGERLRMLPATYRRFLVAVGCFGAGDFAHTMLILLATQKLAPSLGPAMAATAAVALYVLHNIFYAAFVEEDHHGMAFGVLATVNGR